MTKCLSVILFALALSAQHAPSFEVASIKPAGPEFGGVRGGCHGIDAVYTPGEAAEAPPLGRCVITGARLSHMIGIAWDITMPMLKSPAGWIDMGAERFNLEAEAEDPTHTTQAQLTAMLQALIIERFQLKFHRQPTQVSGFDLAVDKNGPKMPLSKSEDTSEWFGGAGKPSRTAGEFHAKRYSIPELAKMLSVFGGEGPVADRTGLTGLYDISLNWDNDRGPPSPPPFASNSGFA